jgi:hypothetical protein
MAKKIKLTPPSTSKTAAWHALYETAVQARKLAPWEWMYEDEIFGLRLPDDPQTWYCSIMGANGEHLCYCFYKGDQALSLYLELRADAENNEDFDPYSMLQYQNCLHVSFEDSDVLDPRQKKHLKSLGLSFRGAHQWVSLTDYTPGLFPWLIEEKQVGTLEVLLKQAMAVAGAKEEDEDFFESWDDGDEMPIYTATRNPDGSLSWTENRENIAPESPKGAVHHTAFQANWKKLGGLPQKNHSIGCGFLPYNSPVQDKPTERAYFVKIMVVVDLKTGMILGMGMGNAAQNEEGVLKAFQGLGFRPESVLTDSDAAVNILKSGCDLAGIAIKIDPKAKKMLREVSKSFLSMAGGGF